MTRIAAIGRGQAIAGGAPVRLTSSTSRPAGILREPAKRRRFSRGSRSGSPINGRAGLQEAQRLGVPAGAVTTMRPNCERRLVRPSRLLPAGGRIRPGTVVHPTVPYRSASPVGIVSPAPGLARHEHPGWSANLRTGVPQRRRPGRAPAGRSKGSGRRTDEGLGGPVHGASRWRLAPR